MIPDHRHVPRKLFDAGLYDLKTHDGQAAFTDAVVATLNGIDPHWRHLRKSSGQTHVHRHGEDSVLYLLPDNKAQAVDFIVGAGGPNPGPGWGPDPEPFYTHADAHDPGDHGIGGSAQPAPTMPSYAQLGDDAFFRAMVGVPLEADMWSVGQRLNDGSAVWFSRTTYSLMAALIASHGAPVDVNGIVKRHRNEWRVLLGLPPL